MKSIKEKSYSELIKIKTFNERLKYLKLDQNVGQETFGSKRYMNQNFYRSAEWREIRKRIILRDDGCDLGIKGLYINGPIYIHHINPLSTDIFHNENDFIEYNLDDNLICCSYNTHNAIHFQKESVDMNGYVERKPGDTKLW